MGAKGSFMEHDNQFQSRVFKDLLSFALDEQPVPYDDQRPLYVDAERPNLSLNASQFRYLVQTLIAGLRRRAGIQSGDVVLVTLPNNVFHQIHFVSFSLSLS
jgi:non-ribosomal peptide synthetase component E (peptide arylation enzyme)